MQHFLVMLVITLSAAGAFLFSGNTIDGIEASSYVETDREAVEREQIDQYTDNGHLEKKEEPVERGSIVGKGKVMYYEARNKRDRSIITDWLPRSLTGTLFIAIMLRFTQKIDEMEQI